jgi:membrane protease YdiL (CAAX protease family)
MAEQTTELIKQSKQKNYAKRYVVTTYLVFWLGILLVGAAFLNSDQNRTVMNWGSAVASWVPTIILMVMFKRLVPGTTRRKWIKNAFAPRLKFGLLIIIALSFIISIGGTYVIMLNRNSHLSVNDLRNLTLQSLASTAFFAIIQGATGEEAGWRGYLQRYFEDKTGGKVIRSALMVGLIWSFWHTPLWISTGLPIIQMLLYIGTFIVGNLCLAVIIAVCYSYCRNLIVPMWIHFISNFLSTILEPYVGNVPSVLEARCWLSIFYVSAALFFSLWHIVRINKASNGMLVR